jgi:uncharacterized membrane protein YphA (DoxX/SURF4 family)
MREESSYREPPLAGSPRHGTEETVDAQQVACPLCELGKFHLRLFVGVMFCAHGCWKLFGMGSIPRLKSLSSTAWSPGAPRATGFDIVELIGGLALIPGLFSRYMALVLSVLMAGAIFSRAHAVWVLLPSERS